MTLASVMVAIGAVGFIMLWLSRDNRHQERLCRRYERIARYARKNHVVAFLRRHDR